MSNFLLVGNGPSALSKEMGELIDNFDGDVVRFNNYHIQGFEKWVGSRTDIWITTDRFARITEPHKRRVLIHGDRSGKADVLAEQLGAERIHPAIWLDCGRAMKHSAPSSGAIAVHMLLQEGHSVVLWGFDFLMERRNHHYHKPEKENRGPWHDSIKEWDFFNDLLFGDKPVDYLGWDREMESIPLVRQPLPCGTDDNVSAYRDPAHQAWYAWFASQMDRGASVLDVGAGMCAGLRLLREEGAGDVRGFDVDERLAGLDDGLTIGKGVEDLANYPDGSVDYITCVDVIEHVVHDMELMRHMRRIARKAIFLTTPHGVRSKAGNPAHCREYSIPQFANVFQPQSIYSASPDGRVHRTKLLERTAAGDWLNFSPQGPMNRIEAEPINHGALVPWSTRFNHTVDGKEWGHIAGIFLL